MTDVIDLGRTTRAKAQAGFRRGFFPAELKRPHPIRRMAILKAHPEVRALMGQDIWTFWITLGVVLGQAAMAYGLGRLGIGYWWLTLIVAWGIGAFPNHAMFVAIHDYTHNLVFKNVVLNKLGLILADLPNTMPTGMGFRCYHVKHHSHLGDYDFDADLPSRWEADLVGNKWYMKAGWLFFFAIFQLTRLERLKGTVPMKQPLDDLQWRLPCSPSTRRSCISAASTACSTCSPRSGSRSGCTRSARAGCRSISRSTPSRRPSTITGR